MSLNTKSQSKMNMPVRDMLRNPQFRRLGCMQRWSPEMLADLLRLYDFNITKEVERNPIQITFDIGDTLRVGIKPFDYFSRCIGSCINQQRLAAGTSTFDPTVGDSYVFMAVLNWMTAGLPPSWIKTDTSGLKGRYQLACQAVEDFESYLAAIQIKERQKKIASQEHHDLLREAESFYHDSIALDALSAAQYNTIYATRINDRVPGVTQGPSHSEALKCFGEDLIGLFKKPEVVYGTPQPDNHHNQINSIVTPKESEMFTQKIAATSEKPAFTPAPVYEILTTVTYVYGQDASTMSDEQLIEAIRRASSQIDYMDLLDSESKFIVAKREAMRHSRQKIIAILDARMPVAPATPAQAQKVSQVVKSSKL